MCSKTGFQNMCVEWISCFWWLISAMMVVMLASSFNRRAFNAFWAVQAKPKIFAKSISKVSTKLFNIRSWPFCKTIHIKRELVFRLMFQRSYLALHRSIFSIPRNMLKRSTFNCHFLLFVLSKKNRP